MPVYQAGQLNVTSLQAPDLYVIIQPPSTAYINGVPTDGLGLVGVGSWGPVNAVMLGIGTNAQAQQAIGAVTNRSHDLATAVAVAVQNNVQNFGLVRVTDGTDTAASAMVKDSAGTPVTGLTLTAMYSGVVGNGITASIVAGTAPNTFKLSVQRQGFTPEVYDNIAGTAAAFWANAVAAVNQGQNGGRGRGGGRRDLRGGEHRHVQRCAQRHEHVHALGRHRRRFGCDRRHAGRRRWPDAHRHVCAAQVGHAGG